MVMLVRLIGSALLLYAAFIGLLFVMERTFLYPASSQRVTAPQAGLSDFQDLTLTTGDGERLVAWWKPPQPGRAIVLYFRGNGGSLSNRRDRVRLLTEDGRGLLIVSYRGYSGSTGTPTE